MFVVQTKSQDTVPAIASHWLVTWGLVTSQWPAQHWRLVREFFNIIMSHFYIIIYYIYHVIGMRRVAHGSPPNSCHRRGFEPKAVVKDQPSRHFGYRRRHASHSVPNWPIITVPHMTRRCPRCRTSIVPFLGRYLIWRTVTSLWNGTIITKVMPTKGTSNFTVYYDSEQFCKRYLTQKEP